MLLEAHDRLVVQLELTGIDRVLQLRAQLEPLDHAFVHRRFENPVAPLAVTLGHVHRDVGVPEELGCIRNRDLAVDEADSDARAREDLLVLDLGWNLQGLENPRRCIGGLRRIRHALDEDGELVATEAGDRVGGAHGDQQPPSDLLKHPVSGRVAEAVVDGLEIVEVDEHHGNVGESGHRVVERLVCQLLLERLPLAHVTAVEDDAPDVLVMP